MGEKKNVDRAKMVGLPIFAGDEFVGELLVESGDDGNVAIYGNVSDAQSLAIRLRKREAKLDASRDKVIGELREFEVEYDKKVDDIRMKVDNLRSFSREIRDDFSGIVALSGRFKMLCKELEKI